jgi:hypothetical protein
MPRRATPSRARRAAPNMPRSPREDGVNKPSRGPRGPIAPPVNNPSRGPRRTNSASCNWAPQGRQAYAARKNTKQPNA